MAESFRDLPLRCGAACERIWVNHGNINLRRCTIPGDPSKTLLWRRVETNMHLRQRSVPYFNFF